MAMAMTNNLSMQLKNDEWKTRRFHNERLDNAVRVKGKANQSLWIEQEMRKTRKDRINPIDTICPATSEHLTTDTVQIRTHRCALYLTIDCEVVVY